ncbi:Uncharacterised protein [Vibrio cholerae]|nr:Uncharacterised protein [Vibrio cholerae]
MGSQSSNRECPTSQPTPLIESSSMSFSSPPPPSHRLAQPRYALHLDGFGWHNRCHLYAGLGSSEIHGAAHQSHPPFHRLTTWFGSHSAGYLDLSP